MGFTGGPAHWSRLPSVHPHVRKVYHLRRGESTALSSVHPHARGACWNSFFGRSGYFGPSPRVWGLPSDVGGDIVHHWSIPTCVGFTMHSNVSIRSVTVHPHVRGVYKEIAPTFKNRGRSIPTRVGFARSWGSGSLDRTVHSHACGVYRQIKTVVDNVVGPSPRAWGLLPRSGNTLFQLRSIPTCVGFTKCRSSVYWCRPVHPHVRGVYLTFRGCFGSRYGPSPRAWGLRHLPHEARGLARSIPTCVGFT